MTKVQVTRRESISLQHELLVALQQLVPPVTNHALPSQKMWPSTRQLAMSLDIEIYRARYSPHGVIRKNHLIVNDHAVNNHLFWLPIIERTTPSPLENLLSAKAIDNQ